MSRYTSHTSALRRLRRRAALLAASTAAIFVGAGVMLSPSAGATTASAIVAVHLGPTPIADNGQTAKPPPEKVPFLVITMNPVTISSYN
jgi:hypothetical protein